MLRLTGIRAGYGRVEVLRGVDLTVPDGSVVALLGANGAGKTTLLRVAAGLLTPNAGEVLLDGDPVGTSPGHVRTRKGLCLIPEGRGIFRPLSVRENLSMFSSGGHPRTPGHGGRQVPAAVGTAVAAFPRLSERLSARAGTLSGGEQQMLAVSRAFLGDYRLIMADELSVGLAPVVVDEIFASIGRLKSEGRSLLVVEQYVDRILDIADYVYILHKGRIAFVGEPAQCRHSGVFEQYLGR